MADGLAARRAAAELLMQVTAGRMLSDVLADPASPLLRLGPDDRARAQRLALAALRRLGPLDALVAPLLRRAPPAEARAILLLAASELADRPEDAHGIVNAAVTLAREGRRTTAAAGFVNAVLRKVAQDPGLRRLPPQQMPRWIRQPLVQEHGREVVKAIEAVQAATPPLDLTLRDPSQAADWAGRLGAEVLPTGSLRLAAGVQVSALAGYDTGDWWVQDAAAAVPARVLAPQPGESVLDLCAAPGGKTLQMAAAGARVTALDISGPRMERLRSNLARTGLQADCVVADALHWQPAAPFDAVLLDAPCSATGTMRRHPDLPFAKDDTDLPALIALQAALIDRAVALVRPGGRIVYCTCSLLPAEGEAQLAAALARHPALRPGSATAGLPPDCAALWQGPGGGLRLRPDHWVARGGIDGFFIALLHRS